MQVREPTKRSPGSIGAAADKRLQPVGKLVIRKDFRHHRINENTKFPTKSFVQPRHLNKINYLATGRSGGASITVVVQCVSLPMGQFLTHPEPKEPDGLSHRSNREICPSRGDGNMPRTSIRTPRPCGLNFAPAVLGGAPTSGANSGNATLASSFRLEGSGTTFLKVVCLEFVGLQSLLERISRPSQRSVVGCRQGGPPMKAGTESVAWMPPW